MLNFRYAAIAIFFVASLFISCKKDGDKSSSRKVKYEITGNFTGKLLIVYNDNVNGNTTINNASVPWLKEMNYASNVTGIGIGGNATATGSPGQVVTVKIYVNNTVVKSDNATAGSLGELSLPTMAHVF